MITTTLVHHADYSYDGIDQDCDGSDTVGFVCTDECIFDDDGICDDGGPNSSFSLCEGGTDCTDCGAKLIQTKINGLQIKKVVQIVMMQITL